MLRSSSASCEPAAVCSVYGARLFSSAFPTRLHETHVLDPELHRRPKHRKSHTFTKKGKAERQPVPASSELA